VDIHDTRYAKTPDGAYIAYQTAGEGPIDLVWQFDFVGNVDLAWEWPGLRGWLPGLAAFCRVILHDRRGTGLSSRNVAPPNLKTRVSDLRLVLDAVGSDRPVLAGFSEAGAPNVMFAATNPERVRSIVWFVASGSDRIRSEDPK
jgi:pimeloyl-ACP methyl ester carboxylesterase